jgi:hypothetical protein
MNKPLRQELCIDRHVRMDATESPLISQMMTS